MFCIKCHQQMRYLSNPSRWACVPCDASQPVTFRDLRASVPIVRRPPSDVFTLPTATEVCGCQPIESVRYAEHRLPGRLSHCLKLQRPYQSQTDALQEASAK